MPWTIERKHDHVAVVTMNTNKVNAQNPVFFADLHAAFDRLEAEFSDCAVVLGGTGAVFSAGLDFDHHSGFKPLWRTTMTILKSVAIIVVCVRAGRSRPEQAIGLTNMVAWCGTNSAVLSRTAAGGSLPQPTRIIDHNKACESWLDAPSRTRLHRDWQSTVDPLV
jgi:hypothetical protein